MRSCALALFVAACGGMPAQQPLPALASSHPTMPLVDPLSDGELLVPVMINKEGPYLFAIDPDAPHTVIEVAVIAQLVDAVGQDTASVELTAGELTAQIQGVQFAAASLDRGSRQLDGVLGRDALGDATVFGFDRDRGVAWLVPDRSYQPPADATAIELAAPTGDGVDRVDALIDDTPRSLVLALGAAHSELHRALWKQLVPYEATIVDDFGNRRAVIDAAVATVATRNLARRELRFVDPSLPHNTADGLLGLDFFTPYRVELSSWTRRIYVRPRTVVTPLERISRWGVLPCPDLGCAYSEVLPTGELRVTRDRQTKDHDLEVTFAGPDAVPALIVELPAGTDQVTGAIPPELAGKLLGVVDVSPFPEHCVGGGGCMHPAR